MFSVSGWTLLLVLLAFVINIYLPLAKNVRIAKALGVAYVIVPFYAYNRVTSLLMNRTLLRLLNSLSSEPSPTSWRRLVNSSWPWKLRHAPFAMLRTDTFLTVAPGGIIVHTADADVISQIIARGTDFLKPTHLYRSVDIYGKNVVSSEGAAWRHHRKLTGPSFSEKNNQLVWKETLNGCQAMLASWVGLDGQGKTIRTVASDTMRLSLNVIGRAGLGQNMEWPNATEDSNESTAQELPYGHAMTFTASITYLLKNVLFIMVLPKWFLKKAPFARVRKSYQSYREWGLYMEEMIAAKKTAMASEKAESATTTDLISQLIKEQESGTNESSPGGQRGVLTEGEVMGNLFVMVIAGHETSANSIHFSLMFLALHPQMQKKVQKELDQVFQGRPVAQWDYERDLPSLLNGMLAAVLHEELRLIAPIITVPKITSNVPQHLKINGKDTTIPANTMVRLCVPSVHSNPKFWPSSDHCHQSQSDDDNDLGEFRPERWLLSAKSEDPPQPMLNSNHATTTSSYASAPSAPSASTHYVPKRGSYIPFSDGPRACLGRRFAQVEILAALAVILTQCSLELAVDEWATDEQVGQMSDRQKRDVWIQAQDQVNWTWQNKMVAIITLQLQGKACVPLRVVPRGKERFAHLF